jgi:hypothetical protein
MAAGCTSGSGAGMSDGGASGCTFLCFESSDERDDTQKVLSILDDRCGSIDGCHGIGVGGMGIATGKELAVLIDVASTEEPSLVRVRPGDPAQSYLWLKLACEGGSQGSCMPADGPLPLEYVQAFHDWIEAGAPPQ